MNHTTPYPRVCAHRGLSALLPANSLEALEAGVSAGAQEIEFDLRLRGTAGLSSATTPCFFWAPTKSRACQRLRTCSNAWAGG